MEEDAKGPGMPCAICSEYAYVHEPCVYLLVHMRCEGELHARLHPLPHEEKDQLIARLRLQIEDQAIRNCDLLFKLKTIRDESDDFPPEAIDAAMKILKVHVNTLSKLEPCERLQENLIRATILDIVDTLIREREAQREKG